MAIPDENKKKGERSDPEGTPKAKTTPNGNQKRGTPVKESPSENQDKKHKRNVSMTIDDFSDDQKSADRQVTRY